MWLDRIRTRYVVWRFRRIVRRRQQRERWHERQAARNYAKAAERQLSVRYGPPPDWTAFTLDGVPNPPPVLIPMCTRCGGLGTIQDIDCIRCHGSGREPGAPDIAPSGR